MMLSAQMITQPSGKTHLETVSRDKFLGSTGKNKYIEVFVKGFIILPFLRSIGMARPNVWQVEDGWMSRMSIGKASLRPGAGDRGPEQEGVADAEEAGG